jgi:hypothetical protein
MNYSSYSIQESGAVPLFLVHEEEVDSPERFLKEASCVLRAMAELRFIAAPLVIGKGIV